MRKLIILFAAVCLLTACDKDKNEDDIAQLFFGESEATNKPNNGKDTPGQVPVNGLVAYYPFDGDTGDASSNSLHAGFEGTIKVTDGHKSDSRCAYFPGNTNSYIYVPFNKKLQMNEWTINVWFNYETAKNKDVALIQMGRNKVPGTFIIGMNFVCWVNSKGVAQYGTLYDDETQLPTSSTWHMITTQVKGTAVKLYFDGKLIWNDSLSATYVNEVTSDLYIGVSKWYGSYDFPFEGCIDDVRIYNRLLSAEEISVLYKN